MKKLISSVIIFFAMCVNYASHSSEATANNNIAQVDLNKKITNATPTKPSLLETKLEKREEASENPFGLALFRPNYILPFYYTVTPDYAAYQGGTPNGQKITHSELKAQISLMVPVIEHLFYNPEASLNLSYTQLSYWQVYASSQFFRETDYEPEIFVQNHFHQNWLLRYGLSHQSNGLGGTRERSWNRAIVGLEWAGEHWLFGVKAWDLIFKAQSSNLYNPHIAHYLGYENVSFAYKYHKATFAIQLQNLESGLRRGFVELTASYPLSKHFLAYTQFFSGDGQSLIEYNHRTNAAGIGLAFNDVI